MYSNSSNSLVEPILKSETSNYTMSTGDGNTDTQEESTEKKSCCERFTTCVKNLTWKDYLKILFVLAIITLFAVAIVNGDTTAQIFQDFLTWMQNNIWLGAFAYIFIYFSATIFMIPGSILTLGAGFVFRQVLGAWAGIFVATLVVLLGAASGATAAFILGRSVLRDKVEGAKAKYPKFDLVDKVVELNGLKVTFLLRLSPIIPFNIFNYFMGLTSVTFRDYCIAHIGMTPGTMAYCFIGGTLGALTDTASVGFGNIEVLILTIVGTIVAIIGMVWVGIYAKKQFNELAAQVEEKNAEKEAEQPHISNDPSTEQEEQTDLKTDGTDGTSEV